MYFNGENLIRRSIKERKEILSSISFKGPIINSIYKLVNSEEEIIALRFPRIKNIREDKNVSDIDSLQKIKQIYEKQTYIMSKISRRGNTNV